MKMFTISATSAWLVQMFEVAFSRRMCCSRVAKRQHESALAVAVRGLPDQAPRHLADELSRASRSLRSTVRRNPEARRTIALPWR